jgi:2-octaprenyl-6-methoxyphenol hydroxylase
MTALDQKTPTNFDVAIVGGGPTGSALALLLARLAPDPARVALFQSEQHTRYDRTVANDTRVIAINEGSRVLLADLNAWPTQVASIHTIHVSQKGRLGRTLIRAEDFAVPSLGHVLRYSQLHETLLEAASQAGVTLFTGEPATARQHGDDVIVTTGDVRTTAKLVIRADGMNHQMQTEPALSPSKETHSQVALLGVARVSQPKVGWAFERFTREGPLAVLPHPDHHGSQSIVWCCAPDRAQALLGLKPDALAHAMQQTFGDRLGQFEVLSDFKGYDLYQSVDPAPVKGRIVNVGNAAQTLHPVAGQGLNLGLRDVATLAHCLRDWMAQSSRDPARSLAIYANLRQYDRTLTVNLTRTMSSIFTTGLSVVEHGAGLALLALDTLPALRGPLARHLMQGLRQ